LPGEDWTLDVTEIRVGKTTVDEPRSTTFYGNLRNFYFDGQYLFDRIQTETPVVAPTSPPDVTTPRPVGPTLVITFPPGPGFIHYVTSSVHISADSRIRFMFRTRDANGLLLYTSRQGDRFLGVELVDGRLMAAANGRVRGPGSGSRAVSQPEGSPSLADGQWHEVDLTRAGDHHFEVRLDGRRLGLLPYPTLSPSVAEEIYLGGVPAVVIPHLPSALRSRKGFSGCMGSLIINGQLYNLQEIVASMHDTQLTAGCTDSNV